MITFNSILRHEGIDPGDVQLVRHQDRRSVKNRSPYSLWRSNPGMLDLYQSIQRKNRLKVGGLLASFVATPNGETLFVGLYRVHTLGVAPQGLVDPVSEVDVSGLYLYEILQEKSLPEYKGLLVIEWGQGFRAWVQKADRQDKPVLEIRRTVADPPFPGFTHFREDTDSIENIPFSWKEVLQSVKGVYVLACKETGKLYVGSAKGDESLWGRFQDYAATGHGGNVELKLRGPKPYQVSVLEVTNSGFGIEKIEEAWKQKLMSREFGLNDPVFGGDLEYLASFAEVFSRERFSFGEWSQKEPVDGVAFVPCFSLSPEAQAFVQMAYDKGWVLSGEFA